MKLYNLLGDDIISKANFLEFVDALQKTPEATGHIIFFGQAEKFCDFIKWDENIYHKKEAKVLLFIFFDYFHFFRILDGNVNEFFMTGPSQVNFLGSF